MRGNGARQEEALRRLGQGCHTAAVQQTSWFRTTAGLGTSVGIWAVLLALDVWLLIADPTHQQQHALLLLAPLVLGGVAVGRLRAARRARAALQQQPLDDGA